MRYRDEEAVVASWFGEGATSEGDWHEGLNFAGDPHLPVLFVCENNEYAISVPQAKQMAVRDVAEPGRGLRHARGRRGRERRARVLRGHAGRRATRAIAGDGPTLIECKTYRYLPHTSDDDDKSYRSREEVDEAQAPRPASTASRRT